MHRRAVEGSDRTLAVLAHASIGFGLVGIGFLLGLAINGIIWLRSRRSSFVNVHAEQAGAYQLAVFLINLGLVLIFGATGLYLAFAPSAIGPSELSSPQVLAGVWLAILPLALLWCRGSTASGLYGAWRVARGREFSYPVFGAWARRRAEIGGDPS